MADESSKDVVDGVNVEDVLISLISLDTMTCERLGWADPEDIEVNWGRAHRRSSIDAAVVYKIFNRFRLVSTTNSEDPDVAKCDLVYVAVLSCPDEDQATAIASSDHWLSTVQRMVHPLVRARLMTAMADMDIPVPPLPLIGPSDNESTDLDQADPTEDEAVSETGN